MLSKGDVTVRMEDEITREFLDNILASMQGGVFTIDKNAKITSFNRAAEKSTAVRRSPIKQGIKSP